MGNDILSLKVQNITKSYNSLEGCKTVINQFSYEFLSGEMTIITGKSGSGKTTLLSLLGLLDLPDEGTLNIGCTDPYKLSDKERWGFRKQVFSYIFQRSGLIENMTIYQNLLLPLLYTRPKTSRSQVDAKILAALQSSSIDISVDRIVHTLSGGERIRIAIARALIAPYDILLCDEPSASLDKYNSKKIGTKLKSVSRLGKTVIVASHDADLYGFADKIITLENR